MSAMKKIDQLAGSAAPEMEGVVLAEWWHRQTLHDKVVGSVVVNA
jgi:hypothetical protein